MTEREQQLLRQTIDSWSYQQLTDAREYIDTRLDAMESPPAESAYRRAAAEDARQIDGNVGGEG